MVRLCGVAWRYFLPCPIAERMKVGTGAIADPYDT